MWGIYFFFKVYVENIICLMLIPFFMYLYEWETSLGWNVYRSFSKEP